jgi:hypothetical protein
MKTVYDKAMTPSEAVKKAGSHWNMVHGRFKKLNVYDQSDYRRRIIVDPNFCVGAAIANVYQAMTGKLGEYAISIYEAAKREQEEGPNPKNADKPGIPIHIGCAVATERYGGDYHQLHTMKEILSWMQVVGPVVIGFVWSDGMEYPVARGGWWKRLWGPRWMNPSHKTTGRSGYHATAAIGASYKDGGFVWIENSRGLTWGNKGTARLSWADLEAMMTGNKAWVYGLDFPTG